MVRVSVTQVSTSEGTAITQIHTWVRVLDRRNYENTRPRKV